MPLIDAVRDHGLTQPDDDTLSWLGESVIVRTDRTAYTWAGLGVRAGIATAAAVGVLVDTLAGSGGDAAAMAIQFRRSLNSGGVNFAEAEVRASLAAVRAGLPDGYKPLIDALLEVGVTHAARYTEYGIDVLPTLEQVAGAKAEALSRDAKNALVVSLVPLIDDAGTSLADLKSAAAAWGA